MNVESDYAASTNGATATEPPSPSPVDGARDLVRSRPEVLVGAAFAGGVIAALLLRRLGR
ncbi:MAG TPA: hypothetical protein VGG41_02105 [Solirubrobacteraceae bacterium]|jgi:hypothetical protein